MGTNQYFSSFAKILGVASVTFTSPYFYACIFLLRTMDTELNCEYRQGIEKKILNQYRNNITSTNPYFITAVFEL